MRLSPWWRRRMGNLLGNGCWVKHLSKKLAEKKRLEAKVEDILVGPRESICGLTGYAGRTPERYACHACGNYHLKPPSIGGLHDQEQLRDGKGRYGEEQGQGTEACCGRSVQ